VISRCVINTKVRSVSTVTIILIKLKFIKLHVSAPPTNEQMENYTCFTVYLLFVLFALRCHIVYHKNRYVIYDEQKIIGCKINLCNSYELKSL